MEWWTEANCNTPTNTHALATDKTHTTHRWFVDGSARARGTCYNSLNERTRNGKCQLKRKVQTEFSSICGISIEPLIQDIHLTFIDWQNYRYLFCLATTLFSTKFYHFVFLCVCVFFSEFVDFISLFGTNYYTIVWFLKRACWTIVYSTFLVAPCNRRHSTWEESAWICG